MKEYIFNKETLKIELSFDKAEYQEMDEEQKRDLKSNFLWSGKSACWVSRAKEPNLWRARRTAEALGFAKGEDKGERLTFAEQVEQKQERAEARADRFEGYADNAEKRAERLQADFNECRKDWSWLTQPNINTAGGRAFTNQRNKIIARHEKGFKEHDKSQYFKDRAETSRETAQGRFDDVRYLNNRIKECKLHIVHLQKNLDSVNEKISRAEQGERVYYADGGVYHIEDMHKRKNDYLERINAQADKMAFMESKLAELK